MSREVSAKGSYVPLAANVVQHELHGAVLCGERMNDEKSIPSV